MLKSIEKAVKNLFNVPADAFYTGRVMDLLFDGVLIDCSSNDQITAALCLNFEDTSAFRKINNTHLAFSMFGGVSSINEWSHCFDFFLRFKCDPYVGISIHNSVYIYVMDCYFQSNASDMGEMKVYRGKKNHKDLGRLIAYNGDTGNL